jgi:plasmid stabilization system protein ParE
MAQKVIWTVSAIQDLQNIVEFIAQDSPYYAMSVYEDLMGKAQTLIEFPHRGRVVPEFDDPKVRELFIHRYRFIYQIVEGDIIITTIIHGARDFKGSEAYD